MGKLYECGIAQCAAVFSDSHLNFSAFQLSEFQLLTMEWETATVDL
jgi:hypothetical protein